MSPGGVGGARLEEEESNGEGWGGGGNTLFAQPKTSALLCTQLIEFLR